MIRAAQEDDFPAMVRLGDEFWRQTVYGHIPYCPDSIYATFRKLAESGVLLVDYREGELLGFIGAVLSPFFANKDISILTELFFYVAKGARGGPTATGLITETERIAKTAGIAFVGMMSLENLKANRLQTFYESLGYQLAERTYVKEI